MPNILFDPLLSKDQCIWLRAYLPTTYSILQWPRLCLARYKLCSIPTNRRAELPASAPYRCSITSAAASHAPLNKTCFASSSPRATSVAPAKQPRPNSPSARAHPRSISRTARPHCVWFNNILPTAPTATPDPASNAAAISAVAVAAAAAP